MGDPALIFLGEQCKMLISV